MNEQSPTTYNLELIAQRRLEKREEVLRSKERIGKLAQDLLSPPESQSKFENMMNHVNAGIAAYDGLRTGIMILQRIRRFFQKTQTKHKPAK